jgi:hypothetical protein
VLFWKAECSADEEAKMSQCLPRSWTTKIVLAGLVIAGGIQPAAAMKNLNESGTFDCSCSGGSGTCTFESSTDNTSCYKGTSATCTGTCKLTIIPDKPKASISKIQGGAGTNAKTMKK